MDCITNNNNMKLFFMLDICYIRLFYWSVYYTRSSVRYYQTDSIVYDCARKLTQLCLITLTTAKKKERRELLYDEFSS